MLIANLNGGGGMCGRKAIAAELPSSRRFRRSSSFSQSSRKDFSSMAQLTHATCGHADCRQTHRNTTTPPNPPHTDTYACTRACTHPGVHSHTSTLTHRHSHTHPHTPHTHTRMHAHIRHAPSHTHASMQHGGRIRTHSQTHLCQHHVPVLSSPRLSAVM
jgi:hypothetical protein